jgi:hypothetical protein
MVKSVVVIWHRAHSLKVLLEPLLAASFLHLLTKSRTYHSSWIAASVMFFGYPATSNSWPIAFSLSAASFEASSSSISCASKITYSSEVIVQPGTSWPRIGDSFPISDVVFALVALGVAIENSAGGGPR